MSINDDIYNFFIIIRISQLDELKLTYDALQESHSQIINDHSSLKTEHSALVGILIYIMFFSYKDIYIYLKKDYVNIFCCIHMCS
jgi:hypothetical protein